MSSKEQREAVFQEVADRLDLEPHGRPEELPDGSRLQSYNWPKANSYHRYDHLLWVRHHLDGSWGIALQPEGPGDADSVVNALRKMVDATA